MSAIKSKLQRDPAGTGWLVQVSSHLTIFALLAALLPAQEAAP